MSPALEPKNTIETRGLNLWYGDFQALKDITLRIRGQRITALIGPSGCGKTTLLRCLVGMVFQRPNPLPISVYENVIFGLRVHTPRRELRKSRCDEAVEMALREVGLWDDLKDKLHTRATMLQLAEQQRPCIARLLPLKPEVILMDEPCSALDSESTLAIKELMLTLADRYTIVTVTHNMAQARRISQECAFMLLGEVVEHARTETLFLTPRDPRTADYIEGRFG